MDSVNEEYESLAGPADPEPQFRQHPPKHSHETKKTFEISGATANLLTILVLVVAAVILYRFTHRIFSISAKQEELKGVLEVYQQAVAKLEHKSKILNATIGSPFSEEELEKYDTLIKQIKQIEETLSGTKGASVELSSEVTEVMSIVQSAIAERSALINMLVAHSKDYIRKQKIDMFTKIAAKSEFQEEKVRNPWALSRLNLRTPYIDTLERRHMEEEVQKEMERLEEKYHFSQFDTELPLCVVVPTRNNAKNYRYEYNLQSILNQNYNNYKIVVVDDASTDATGELIQIFLRHSNFPPERYYYVRNKERMSAVPNIHHAIKNYCSTNDIAVLVSGDDELLGKLVFKILNVVYQTKKPGLAYTNHFYGKLHEKDFEKGYSRTYTLGEIKNKLYRFIGQKFGHMRTFPVSIFLEIKEEHMKDREGKWIQATYDETFILPILEMACDSIEYIDEYVYLYNYGTGENDGEIHHDAQSAAALYVRELPRYNCIEKYQKYVI